MHTGGIVKGKPVPTCSRHDMPLMQTHQYMGPTIWTCPACNTEIIDRLTSDPGVIKIKNTRT
jgi:hypothetical protein